MDVTEQVNEPGRQKGIHGELGQKNQMEAGSNLDEGRPGQENRNEMKCGKRKQKDMDSRWIEKISQFKRNCQG